MMRRPVAYGGENKEPVATSGGLAFGAGIRVENRPERSLRPLLNFSRADIRCRGPQNSPARTAWLSASTPAPCGSTTYHRRAFASSRTSVSVNAHEISVYMALVQLAAISPLNWQLPGTTCASSRRRVISGHYQKRGLILRIEDAKKSRKSLRTRTHSALVFRTSWFVP